MSSSNISQAPFQTSVTSNSSASKEKEQLKRMDVEDNETILNDDEERRKSGIYDIEKKISEKNEGDDEGETPRNQEARNLEAEKQQAEEDDPTSGWGFFFVMAGLCCCVFIVSLDQTIIAPALPAISDHFKALQDVGWYGSAYFLTTTSLQPLFGRLYAMYDLKIVYMICIVIFEVGSLLCGVATSSKMFIVGRAIAGLGVAGAYIGTLTIVAVMVPVRKQALYTGMTGAAYGAGGISGPLIGGAFTTKVTWRWCFYLNLPIGGLVLVLIALLFHPPKSQDKRTHLEKLRGIDWVGSALVLGSTTCLLLVCQDGGLTYAWGNSRIIGMLVGFVVIWIAFWIWQYYMGESATIPIRLITDRTLGFASLCNFCIGGSYFNWAYFIPIYFQTARGSSAIRSGVQTLPLITGAIGAVTVSGGMIPKFGYPNPFMIIGGVIASIGSGLLYTLSLNSSTGKWVGYQIITGLGAGMSFMIPVNVVQAKLTGTKDLELGTAVVIFFQTLGGCFFVSIAESIYQNKLDGGLAAVLPANQVSQIIAGGLTGFRDTISGSTLDAVLNVVINSINDAFIPPIALACCWTLGSLFLDWNSVKGMQPAAMAA